MFRDGIARLLVFQLGAERFAVALEAVDEVIDAPAVQPLPDASPDIRGIATLPGGLVTVYDPRRLLNTGAGIDGAALLFRRDDRRVALAVDEVCDALVVNEHELLGVPGGNGSDTMLIGVIRRGNELIAVLSANALLDAVTVVGQGERM